MSRFVNYVGVRTDPQFVMTTGMISAASLVKRRSKAGGHGIRLYCKVGEYSPTAEFWRGVIVELLSERQSDAANAPDLWLELAKTGVSSRAAAEPRFVMIEPKARQVRRLDTCTGKELQRSVDAWLESASRNELILELAAATKAELAEVLRQFGVPMSEDASGPTRVGGEWGLETGLPHETSESAAMRNELAKEWLDAKGVSKLLGSRAENASHLPNRLRRHGKILGVWCVADHGYRFPPWQFIHGQPIKEFSEVLKLLRGDNGVAAGRKSSGWQEVEWLCSPHALLHGRRPCEVLASDPQRVLKVAEREFTEGVNARW